METKVINIQANNNQPVNDTTENTERKKPAIMSMMTVILMLILMIQKSNNMQTATTNLTSKTTNFELSVEQEKSDVLEALSKITGLFSNPKLDGKSDETVALVHALRFVNDGGTSEQSYNWKDSNGEERHTQLSDTEIKAFREVLDAVPGILVYKNGECDYQASYKHFDGNGKDEIGDQNSTHLNELQQKYSEVQSQWNVYVKAAEQAPETLQNLVDALIQFLQTWIQSGQTPASQPGFVANLLSH